MKTLFSIFLLLIVFNYSKCKSLLNHYKNVSGEIKKKKDKNLFYTEYNFSLSDQTLFRPIIFQYWKIIFSNSAKEVNDLLFKGDCLDSFYLNNSSYSQDVFLNTGKSINDLGDPIQCKIKNLTFHLIELNLNLTNFNDEELKDYFNFIGNQKVYYGLCLINNCDQYIHSSINQTENKPLMDFLSKYYYNLTIFKLDNENKENELSFYIIIIIFLAFIVIRIIISIVGSIIYYKDFSQYQESSENLISTTPLDEEHKSSNFKDIKPILLHKTLFYRVFKILSFSKSIKCIFSNDNNYSNKIYKDKNIVLFLGFKYIFCFFFLLNHVFFTLLGFPHSSIDNDIQFMKSPWMAIIRLSTFSTEIIVCINGIILSFKLMNYLKKYNNFSFVSFAYFGISLIYKTITFYFILFIFYLNVDHFTEIFEGNDSDLFNYVKQKFHRDCYKSYKFLYIPFYYQYYYNDNKENSFSECYRTYFFIQSEFYCVILTLIIFYIIFRFKSKLLEILILLTSLFSFGTIYCYIKFQRTYTLSVFLGEVNSIKRPHLLYPSFFLGNIAGVTYFYYCDILSVQPMIENLEYKYLPFKYFYTVIKLFDQQRKLIKYLTKFVLYFLSLVVCFNFYFIQKRYNNNSNLFIDPIGDFINLIFIFERKIFNLLLIAILFSIICLGKSNLNLTITTNYFSYFENFSLIFLLLVDSFSYVFFGLVKIEVLINSNNLFLLSIGLFIVLYVISSILTICLEVPFRILLKNFVRSKLTQKHEIDNNS